MNLLIITQKVDEEDQLLGFFVDWLTRFSAKFEKVTVICQKSGRFNLPANIEVVSIGKDRGLLKASQLFNFYSAIIGRRKDYDAVFVHMNPIWVVLGGWWWRISGKMIYFWYTHKAVTPKLRLAEKLANTVFTASKESFRLASSKVIVTGHGIDTDLFRPDYSKKLAGLNILSVGRIAPVKNYETLIHAASLLKNKGILFSVTIIGEPALESDKDYEAAIKKMIKELQLEDNFKFLGKVNHRDILPYYQSHDIFVHMSKTGSVDKTLLEAMACGMKVLSSNDSAKSFLPDRLIFNNENPAELADKIENMSHEQPDPALRSYVAANHNLNTLINKMSDIING